MHGLYLKSEAGKEKVFSEVLMDFQYYMPARIVSGEDCVKKNASLLRTLGKNVLVVTGKSSAKNGALEDAVFAFNMNGQKYTIYDRVPNNPTVACVEEGARIAREVGADCVVAIGGGSPMDAAKAIAMLARQDAPEGIFAHAITDDILPMAHIPTTAGTGSEVTPYSIITNDEKQTKTSISAPSLFPVYAFLDGKYMASLPQNVTVNTALDELSHAVEGMLSVRATLITDALARESIRLLTGEYDSLLNANYTSQSRQNLLLGSTLAGMVIANTGTTVVHGMGYSLTYFDDVPHGRANGLLLPAFLAECNRKAPQRVGQICDVLGMDLETFSKKVAALLGKREEYSDTELADFARRASVNKNIKNCTVHFSEEELLRVLKQSLGA